MVHAGAGSNRRRAEQGTLVNALLHHMAKLSEVGGELRPGIVHRLDKQTSGAIVVAKDDVTHRKLGEMFSGRRMREDLHRAGAWQSRKGQHHGEPAHRARPGPADAHDHAPSGSAAARCRTSGCWSGWRRAMARSPWSRCGSRPGGRTRFACICSRLGHPVVGDTLYGAPRLLVPAVRRRRKRASNGGASAGAGAELSACRASGVRASADGQGVGDRCSAAGGTGGVSCSGSGRSVRRLGRIMRVNELFRTSRT